MNEIAFPMTVGVFVGLASGFVGSLMVLKKMSLVGDALSHVALPGIAVAFLININPFIGAFAALFTGIIIIWKIEQRTHLPSETLVGALFASSLALGLLLVPDEEILEALFGDISQVSALDVFFGVFFSIVVIFITNKIYKKLILGIISPDLAQSRNINSSAVNLIFMIMIAIIVSLGIKSVGTLLMGALVIIPAASAKNLTNQIKHFTNLAMFFGSFSAVGGILVSVLFNVPPGPVIILASAALFLTSIVFKR